MSDARLSCNICSGPMTMFIPRIWDDRYGCPGVFSIHRCDNCAQMETQPPLTEADLPALYSTYYPRRNIDFEALEREARSIAEPGAARRRFWRGTDNQGHYLARPGQRVLDIGSGSCMSLLEMRELGVEAYGVEADPNVRAIADRYGLRVHIGSIHDTPFPELSFDLITLNQVIEHVPDAQALLRAVGQRLRPGGRVALSFPNSASLQRRLSGARWINWHVPYHQHHFNRHSFARLAAKEGYEVERVRTVTPNLWTLLQLRAMGRPPVEGQAAAAWGGTGDAPVPFVARVRRGLLRRAQLALSVPIALFNRIVDGLGGGDSLLVVLRKAS